MFYRIATSVPMFDQESDNLLIATDYRGVQGSVAISVDKKVDVDVFFVDVVIFIFNVVIIIVVVIGVVIIVIAVIVNISFELCKVID